MTHSQSAEFVCENIRNLIKERKPTYETKETAKAILEKIISESCNDTQNNEQVIIKGLIQFEDNCEMGPEFEMYLYSDTPDHRQLYKEVKELRVKSTPKDAKTFYNILSNNTHKNCFLLSLFAKENDYNIKHEIDILSGCSKWGFLPILDFDEVGNLRSIKIKADLFSTFCSSVPLLPISFTNIYFDFKNTSLFKRAVEEYLSGFSAPKKESTSPYREYIIWRVYENKLSKNPLKIGRLSKDKDEKRNNLATIITDEINSFKPKDSKDIELDKYSDETINKIATEVNVYCNPNKPYNDEIRAILAKDKESIIRTLCENIIKEIERIRKEKKKEEKKTMKKKAINHN